MSDTKNTLTIAAALLESGDRQRPGSDGHGFMPEPASQYVDRALELHTAAGVALLHRAEEAVPDETEIDRLYQVERVAKTFLEDVQRLTDGVKAHWDEGSNPFDDELIRLDGSFALLQVKLGVGTEEGATSKGAYTVSAGAESVTPAEVVAVLGLVAEEIQYGWSRLEIPDLEDRLEHIVRATSADQLEELSRWAGAIHLHASDNYDVVIPDRPSCLPDYVGPDGSRTCSGCGAVFTKDEPDGCLYCGTGDARDPPKPITQPEQPQ